MVKKGESNIERLLGNIEERVGNLIDRVEENRSENASQHKEIMKIEKDLCDHVNHENKLMDKRITELEKDRDQEVYEKKGQKKIWKWVAGILGLIVTLMSIGHGFGIF